MTDTTPSEDRQTVRGAVLTQTAKYASLLCAVLLAALCMFGNRLLVAFDANTEQLIKIQQRQIATEGGLMAANERIGEVVRQMTSRFDALGQWTRRNADDIDDLKKRVYPLSSHQ